MTNVIRVDARGVGRGGGYASLVTGQHVENGPDLSLFVDNRAAAYTLVDWVTPPLPERTAWERQKRLDRARVDYRDFEPQWLQVKLCVEEEFEHVLQRLDRAIGLRDGYLDAQLIQWAIDPSTHKEPWGYHVWLECEKLAAKS